MVDFVDDFDNFNDWDDAPQGASGLADALAALCGAPQAAGWRATDADGVLADTLLARLYRRDARQLSGAALTAYHARVAALLQRIRTVAAFRAAPLSPSGAEINALTVDVLRVILAPKKPTTARVYRISKAEKHRQKLARYFQRFPRFIMRSKSGQTLVIARVLDRIIVSARGNVIRISPEYLFSNVVQVCAAQGFFPQWDVSTYCPIMDKATRCDIARRAAKWRPAPLDAALARQGKPLPKDWAGRYTPLPVSAATALAWPTDTALPMVTIGKRNRRGDDSPADWESVAY